MLRFFVFVYATALCVFFKWRYRAIPSSIAHSIDARSAPYLFPTHEAGVDSATTAATVLLPPYLPCSCTCPATEPSAGAATTAQTISAISRLSEQVANQFVSPQAPADHRLRLPRFARSLLRRLYTWWQPSPSFIPATLPPILMQPSYATLLESCSCDRMPDRSMAPALPPPPWATVQNIVVIGVHGWALMGMSYISAPLRLLHYNYDLCTLRYLQVGHCLMPKRTIRKNFARIWQRRCDA
jgi:hypothetical protein